MMLGRKVHIQLEHVNLHRVVTFIWFSEEDTKDKGKLYKPMSKLASLAESFASKPKVKESKDKILRKSGEKKKSNLEMFKEELRA